MPRSDIFELTNEEFSILWDAITIIEAQEMLRDLTVQDWPNMKKSERQKLHKQLYKQAYPDIFKEKRTITVEDFATILNR